ncbi:uncharacterized protein KQ657_002912 [Scheffersomyces spartinae]|uniref:Chromatin target of PRMT1 protein C-terminal domain-containing protein n=1 Tax=Scheffersomyces spartinae TaxID=45513 RepID=A0A9P7V5B1_9ASCO|nr:uncharacterized protein KQ657_002912 [Scheffersomyces spartinae]KAG7191643.1 hypothetical protein KQ657_002912 [Scheffersomyces spartinae]
MSELLEKSLDDIIGERPPRERRQQNVAGRNSRRRERGGGRHERERYERDRRVPPHHRDTYRPPHRASHRSSGNSGIPEEIAAMAGDRPLLRVKNIHSELNGRDLSELFGLISPVEFVKFDPQRETVAYVLFEADQKKNNSLAVEKFDGRQAMRRTLIVENTTLLADRIVAPERDVNTMLTIDASTRIGTRERNRGPRRRERPVRAKKPNPNPKVRSKPPTVDDLDEQLNAYMNSREDSSATANEGQEKMAVD